MNIGSLAALAVSVLVVPLLFTLVDMAGSLRAHSARRTYDPPTTEEDFEVLVPIYGNVRYLENVPYLRDYGRRVLLCTTTSETPEFDAQLETIAAANGFRIFRGEVPRPSEGRSGKRQTGGTIRDRVVRDALETVRAPWVVCIDADTITTRPLGELVGALAARRLDLASIRLVPSNTEKVLGRIQVHEYRLAMQLRRVVPWLVSGACHAARTEVHRQVMRRHSLFFQGNDVELGILADSLGYRVGHVPFEVPTTVPDRVKPWLRQRLAWAGGEVRLFIVNARLARRHPLMWAYGAAAFLLAPVRWITAVDLARDLPCTLSILVLAVVTFLYLALAFYVHWQKRDATLWLMPLYGALSSLVITPLGLLWYIKMGASDHNWGIIRLAGRHRNSRPGAQSDSAVETTRS
ncbi:glycosyltransferase family 2 protein [Streptomyces sp. NPDC018610]|uniref:glycosyltransferase family 2 protein n=1 Tax=Streptomyces sp. NPDC018610 TaxID=3365049 RepID=UPI0037952074